MFRADPYEMYRLRGTVDFKEEFTSHEKTESQHADGSEQPADVDGYSSNVFYLNCVIHYYLVFLTAYKDNCETFISARCF